MGLCGALAIACAGTSIAMVHATSAQAAGMFAGHKVRVPAQAKVQVNAQPWWSGFEDPAMSRLMAASQGRADSGVAAAYIALKVKTLELVCLENTRDAVQRQSSLLRGSAPPHDDFAKQLDVRKAAASASIEKLRAQRASYIGYLATQCHMSEAAMNALLAAALYGMDAASDANAWPGGAIDAGEEAQAIDMSGPPLYAQAVAQARDQVAAALQRLQMHSDIAQAAYARVVSARAGFEQSKARRDRAEISEVQLMEDFQGLLLDLHVLAAANGELALAWVVFMGSIGNGTPIDAVADPLATPMPFLHKVSRKLRNP